ncbi:hypothetical protein HPB47_015609, partial [Ixodes persulcatus]
DENIPPTPCVLYTKQELDDADFLHLAVDPSSGHVPRCFIGSSRTVLPLCAVARVLHIRLDPNFCCEPGTAA